MITQEIAKKPNARTRVKCTQCAKEYAFSAKSIIEEPLDYPHNTVVEGFLICPHCGLKTHSYYMTERNRFYLDKLKTSIEDWHKMKTNEAYSHYRIQYERYTHNFDSTQKKYKEMFKLEETASE